MVPLQTRNTKILLGAVLCQLKTLVAVELFVGTGTKSAWILNGGLNPLSRISIATLGDLGYTVDYSTAESYGTSAVDSNCRCGLRSLSDSIQPSTAHQLGTNHKSTRRRSLSDEAHQMAVDYGQMILKNRQASKIFSFRSSFNQLGGDVEYIGDKVIVVFVEEGGAFFDVTVYPQV